MQLLAGVEAGTEGATHAAGQRQMDRAVRRSREEEAGISEEEEEKVEETREEGLMVDTEGTEEDAAEILDSALGMEVY